jgi:hypothetical protein
MTAHLSTVLPCPFPAGPASRCHGRSSLRPKRLDQSGKSQMSDSVGNSEMSNDRSRTAATWMSQRLPQRPGSRQQRRRIRKAYSCSDIVGLGRIPQRSIPARVNASLHSHSHDALQGDAP